MKPAIAISGIWWLSIILFVLVRPSITPPGRPDNLDDDFLYFAPLICAVIAFFTRERAPIWTGLLLSVVAYSFVLVNGNGNLKYRIAGEGAFPTLARLSLLSIWAMIGGRCAADVVWYVQDRRRRAIAAGLCPGCGYDLRASKDRCPECGRQIK